MPTAPRNTRNSPASQWLQARGWQAFDFQREVWAAIAAGQSGLLHASTGSGKTLAVALGFVQHGLATLPPTRAAPEISLLWVTPMRALAADTLRALQAPLSDLAPHWTLGLRSSDTPSAERARQDRRLPTVLVTTPESLTVMLSRTDAPQRLATVTGVVVDEWHELLGNKRGVQLQLALARLRHFCPGLLTWGLSATLGNVDEAMHTLLGHALGTRVQGRVDKTLIIDTLIPSNPGTYAWAGHLGARMVDPVVAEIAASGPTLVFTNTRSQAEIWYQLLLEAKPEWAGEIALHHASLHKDVREWVELALKNGKLRAVVATSSLDLGVDFLPVERVLQIGSAKGVARLLQRAGRSGHAPGRPSRITLVPTHTLEMAEAAAARRAALAGHIEKRNSPEQPLDVLVQHIVTVALGGGFRADTLYAEICSAYAYRHLSRADFNWALAFCTGGGDSLAAYPDYHRIAPDNDGLFRVPDARLARRHRMGIGTIVSDGSVRVQYLGGAHIGTVEEGFVARLRKGDCFVFAGRLLEFIRVQDMTAYVRKALKKKGSVPSWQGGKMPLSTEMGEAVLALLQEAALHGVDKDFSEPELRALQPLLQTQARRSYLPTPQTLLVEQYPSREGQHLYLYPFAGRHVHLGLASLLAWRLSKHQPNTFSLAINDYGLELQSTLAFDVLPVLDKSVFSSANLLQDVLASLNSSELAQRRFREIARISGLVFTGFAGAQKSARQLQASSSLFFEVFKKYDSGNLLLGQAEREVLSQELDIDRLRSVLEGLATRRIQQAVLQHPSPLSLPLLVERLREKLSTEKLADRLARLLADLEQA
ncbi:MAG: ligase-associated DNA damage response DEXH box helicase [Burkholderiaceae bacterium]